MQPNLTMVLEQVGKDKGIDKAVLIGTLEQAILTAAKKVFGQERELEAQFNQETGQVDLFQICVVTEDAGMPGRDIGKVDADQHGLQAEIGDELLFQIFYFEGEEPKASEQQKKYGDLIDLHDTIKRFGRIAAQTARQVIIQRIREAERDNVFNEYKDRRHDLITGIVRRFERGNIIVDVGKAEAILPVREQVPRESYRAGDRIEAYVVDIEKNSRGPQIVLSRTHKGLLEKLFEKNVRFTEFASLVSVHGDSLVVLGLLFLLVSMIKSAQFPFSYWLPRAMEGPTTSSARSAVATAASSSNRAQDTS